MKTNQSGSLSVWSQIWTFFLKCVLSVSRFRARPAAHYIATALVASGLGLATQTVIAANADIVVTVKPIPNVTAQDGTVTSSDVSLSRLSDPAALFKAYVAVEVTVQSFTTNVNNAVVFDLPVNVDTGSPASFQGVVGSSCGAGSQFSDTRIICKIGQLRGGATTTFVAVFRTPESGLAIDFPWSLTYSTTGSQSSTPSGTTFSGNARTKLVTDTNPQVSSSFTTYIPPGASTDPALVFFTGKNNGTARSDLSDADKLTSKLIIPRGLPGLTTATVDQTSVTTGQTNDTLTTNTTIITIPAPRGASGQALFFGQSGSDSIADPTNYKPITINLQRDSSTIKTFQGFDRVPIYYTASADEPIPYNGPLMNCTDVGGPNYTYPVCISDRIPLTKKNATGQDVGDWRFVLKALQNGVSRW